MPLGCSLWEERSGALITLRAEVRSGAFRRGSYRLVVVRSGPAGETHLFQYAGIALAPGVPVLIEGPSFTLEAGGSYQATLRVEAGGQRCACEVAGQS